MTSDKKSPQSACRPADNAWREFAFSLAESVPIPTFVLDAQCRVMIWNEACARLTGIPASDVIDTSDHWRGFYKSQRPCLADLIAQDRTREIDSFYHEHGPAAEPTQGIYVESWCLMPLLGTRLYLAADARPIHDREGRLLAVVETLRDQTLQKLAQTALEEASNVDGLTGIANSRAFNETLKLECRRTMRDAQPLSLLKIDIDHFKAYNDTYGHLAGDDCLKRVAQTISNQLKRASDVVGRVGDEDFAVILPNSTLDGATKVAQRIHAAIDKLALPFSDSKSGHLSVSIGAASVAGTPNFDSWQLISTADAALYNAKESGRNRITAMQVEPLGVADSKAS